MSLEREQFAFSRKVIGRVPTIIYELVPPLESLPADEVRKTTLQIAIEVNRLRVPVAAVNIPKPLVSDRVKLEPRLLARYLREKGFRSVIVNQPIVYYPWQEELKWLRENYGKSRITNFIFVGGERSNIDYPGKPVVEAARLVSSEPLNQEFPHIFIGGITIFTRPYEARRLVDKTRAGIKFFTSQVIPGEARHVKLVLQRYFAVSQKEGIEPRMIFLSFAPISTASDMKFLEEKLNVKIPKETKARLDTGWAGMDLRSIELAQELLVSILRFAKKERIEVPLGIQVGHITTHNFLVSLEMVSRLGNVYLNEWWKS